MENKKLKIFILTQDPENNISFYRAFGPVRRLAEHYPIEIMYGKSIEAINQCDLALITCPYMASHLQLIDRLISMGVKVWLDFDDLITDIPVWNERGFLEYSQHPVQKVVEESMKKATWVTVSTQYLKDEWKHLTDDIYVVPNAFDHQFLNKPKPFGAKNEVLYRGGQSHNMDLWAYHKPIINSIKTSGWNPHFVGMNPIYINQELNGSWTPQLNKKDYWNFLENNDAKILIVPLADVPLNRGKSCIAWIEGTYAGCAVLAPDWPEWQKPGVINYTGQVEFEGKLKGMMSGRVDLKSKMEKSREYIMSHQTLLHMNLKRWELIKEYTKN